MPNIKSAKKRAEIAVERRKVNMMRRSALKSSLRKAASSITAGGFEEAKAAVISAIKSLDTAVTKGIIHKNQAARRKSRLTKKLNALAK